jgi:hypothetical protein
MLLRPIPSVNICPTGGWNGATRTTSIVLWVLSLLTSVVFGQEALRLTVAWTPSETPGIVKHRIYYGPAPGTYTNSIEVGNVNTAVLCCFVKDETYYFAVTASMATGGESAFSEELVHTFSALTNAPPTLSSLADLSLSEDAGTQTITLKGIGSGAITESQALTVSATSSNPDLIPRPSISYSSPNITGTLSLTPTPNASGVATITVTIDDGQSQNSRLSRSFQVRVLPINDPPRLDPIANLSLNEDSGLRTIRVTGIGTGAGDEDQPLVLSATSSHPGIIPHPTVSYSSTDSSGTLSFTPVPNASGVATITVNVDDNQSINRLSSRSFTVTVSPVNDPPRMDPLANLTLNEDAWLQTIPLTQIEAGGGNEAQTLTLSAISSAPALIPHPKITYSSPNTTGALALAPAPNAHGIATITVTVNDGQASNNLFSRTFTVTVNAINDLPRLDSIADLTIDANALPQRLELTGIGTGAPNEDQPLEISAISSDPSVIPNPRIVELTPPGAALIFAPASNAVGQATITVTVKDGQPSNNQTFRTFKVDVIELKTNSYYLEAEAGDLSGPIEIMASPSASAESYVYSKYSDQGRIVLWPFIENPGDYVLWARVLSTDSSRDSMYVSVNAGEETIFPVALQTWSSDWQWSRLDDWQASTEILRDQPKLLRLSQGQHQISLRTREAFTLIDAVYLTTDRHAIPPSSSPNQPTAVFLPYPWVSSVIGQAATGNLVSVGVGTYSLAGMGTLSDGADRFLYVHQNLEQDGGLTVHLNLNNDLGPQGFAGIMIRNGLSPTASYIAIGAASGGLIECRSRLVEKAAAASHSSPFEQINHSWLHLRRVGDQVFTYGSLDSNIWFPVGFVNFPDSPLVQIGLVVASGVDTTPFEAKFTDVQITP